jgi:hypothetical protein
MDATLPSNAYSAVSRGTEVCLFAVHKKISPVARGPLLRAREKYIFEIFQKSKHVMADIGQYTVLTKYIS